MKSLFFTSSNKSLFFTSFTKCNYANLEEELAQVIAQKASIVERIDAVLDYLKLVESSPLPDQTISTLPLLVTPNYTQLIRR